MAVFNAQEAILKVYNRATNKSLTVDDVIFGIPIMIPAGYPRNARVKVYPKPHTLETTILPIAYNKIHVSELGTIKVLKGTRTTVHEVLNDIRTNYEYDFKTTDVVNAALPAADAQGYVSITLNFEPGALGYYSGTYIDTAIKLSDDTAEKANADKIAKLNTYTSSFAAIVYMNGTECQTDVHSAVRTDFGVTSGIHYWEAKLIAGGANLGFCTRTANVNLANNTTIGSNPNTWGLNTVTGRFTNNGISVDLSRPIMVGETVGFMLDMTTGMLTVKLHNNEYTIQTTADNYSEIFPMASGDTEIRSTIRFNFGQDPMLFKPPAGVKHGIYTLKQVV